jgi:ABC-type transporter Mla subunit MlaD
MNTALAGNSVAVRQLMDDGSVLAGRLGDMDRQIRTLVGTSDTVMSTYARQNHSIAKILDHLDVLGIRLNSIKGDVDHLIVNFADVQEQLDRLMRNNHGNIDATLSEMQGLVALLARNSKNLETTLCTLPAGLAGYFQTTSWGEWFNVRITKFLLKDRNGKTVWSAGESSNQRSGKSPPPYTRCAGTGSATTHGGGPGASGGHGGGNRGGGRGGGPLPSIPPVPTPSLPVSAPHHAGFGSVGDLIRSVLGEPGRKGARGA